MKSFKSHILCIKQKKLLKEAYNKIINSINPKNRKDAIVKDSENSKRSHHNRLFLNLTGKINLKRSDNCFALSDLSLYYT